MVSEVTSCAETSTPAGDFFASRFAQIDLHQYSCTLEQPLLQTDKPRIPETESLAPSCLKLHLRRNRALVPIAHGLRPSASRSIMTLTPASGWYPTQYSMTDELSC